MAEDAAKAMHLAMGLTKKFESGVMEQVVDALVREVKSRHVRRLRDGLCAVEYGFVLEAHEYLNALKAGELHESAAFAEQFAQYKARYAFPEEN